MISNFQCIIRKCQKTSMYHCSIYILQLKRTSWIKGEYGHGPWSALIQPGLPGTRSAPVSLLYPLNHITQYRHNKGWVVSILLFFRFLLKICVCSYCDKGVCSSRDDIKRRWNAFTIEIRKFDCVRRLVCLIGCESY